MTTSFNNDGRATQKIRIESKGKSTLGQLDLAGIVETALQQQQLPRYPNRTDARLSLKARIMNLQGFKSYRVCHVTLQKSETIMEGSSESRCIAMVSKQHTASQ